MDRRRHEPLQKAVLLVEQQIHAPGQPVVEHGHDHDQGAARLIKLEQDVLARNALGAAKNRGYFAGRKLLALNLVSSPGSGKTTLLERTIRDIGAQRPFVVIQGDQATDRDAERVRRAGARAVQLNTGKMCHLDAAMVERALGELDPPLGAVLAIENVGNLVCPALFDLGEQERVVVASYAEGDDKPIKYPYMFQSASLIVLNKSDLGPYVEFDARKFHEHVASVNPKARVLELSALRGQGLSQWYEWLMGARA